jgi:hypothetical protein
MEIFFLKRDWCRTTSASSLIVGLGYMAGENHHASAHSTKPVSLQQAVDAFSNGLNFQYCSVPAVTGFCAHRRFAT